MILCHAREDDDGGQTATPFVESAVSKFRQFINEIEGYPYEVAHAEHLVALQSAEKGFSALFLAPESTRSLEQKSLCKQSYSLIECVHGASKP